MKKHILLLALTLGLFSAVSCSVKNEPDEDTVKVGQSVPTGMGLPVTDVSFIAFFNPECPDCQKEMPVIQELYDEYCGALNFLVIGRDMTSREIKDYFDENDYFMPFMEDPDRAIYNAFALSTIPRCYLCKDGIVKYIWKDNPIMTKESFETAYKKTK